MKIPSIASFQQDFFKEYRFKQVECTKVEDRAFAEPWNAWQPLLRLEFRRIHCSPSCENPCVPPLMDPMLKITHRHIAILSFVTSPRRNDDEILCSNFWLQHLIPVVEWARKPFDLGFLRFSNISSLPYLEFFTTLTSPPPRCPKDIARRGKQVSLSVCVYNSISVLFSSS